jgi:hypothetical protein
LKLPVINESQYSEKSKTSSSQSVKTLSSIREEVKEEDESANAFEEEKNNNI